MKYNDFFKAIAATLLVVPLFVACSDDNDDSSDSPEESPEVETVTKFDDLSFFQGAFVAAQVAKEATEARRIRQGHLLAFQERSAGSLSSKPVRLLPLSAMSSFRQTIPRSIRNAIPRNGFFLVRRVFTTVSGLCWTNVRTITSPPATTKPPALDSATT